MIQKTEFQYLAAIWIAFSISTHRTSAWSVRRQQATTCTRRQTLTYLLDAGLLLSTASCHARNLPESTGASTAKIGTVEALVPIVRLRETVKQLAQQQQQENVSSSPLFASIPKTEREFKKLFDAYSEPVSYKQKFLDQNAFLVYYTKGFDGSNRPSIESDLPVLQTKQFGARNEAWIAWSDLQAELDYVKSHPDDDAGESDDVPKLLKQLYEAIDSYLQLAPPDDVAKALKEVNLR